MLVCAALCIEGMINVIIDSHQEMFYSLAVLEILSHKNIRSIDLQNLKIPTEEPHQGCFSKFFQNNFSTEPLSFVYV